MLLSTARFCCSRRLPPSKRSSSGSERPLTHQAGRESTGRWFNLLWARKHRRRDDEQVRWSKRASRLLAHSRMQVVRYHRRSAWHYARESNLLPQHLLRRILPRSRTKGHFHLSSQPALCQSVDGRSGAVATGVLVELAQGEHVGIHLARDSTVRSSMELSPSQALSLPQRDDSSREPQAASTARGASRRVLT